MFRLSIRALDENIFEGEADSLTLPGVDGELTILKNHIPIITPLRAGKLRFMAPRKEIDILIRSGVLQVNPEKVIVLVNI